jgi:hypothetical protein
MLHIPAMQLKHETAVVFETFVFRTAVGAFAAE